jgi:hypothetical protein
MIFEIHFIRIYICMNIIVTKTWFIKLSSTDNDKITRSDTFIRDLTIVGVSL